MVKCSECGFLAARNTETRILEEVEYKSRQDGNMGRQRYVLIPVCFAMAFNFDKEVKELRKSPKFATRRNEIGEIIYPEWKDCVKPILNMERECSSFVQWQQGFTPKEHQEMMDRQEWRNWQEKQRKEDKHWRIIELIVFGVIAVLVAGGFTILGALIERGSIP
jgi:hypothetical protein